MKFVLFVFIGCLSITNSKAQIFVGHTKSNIIDYIKKEYPQSEYQGEQVRNNKRSMSILIPGPTINDRVLWTFFIDEKDICHKTFTVMDKNNIMKYKSSFDEGFIKLTDYIWINKEKNAVINIQTTSADSAFVIVIIEI